MEKSTFSIGIQACIQSSNWIIAGRTTVDVNTRITTKHFSNQDDGAKISLVLEAMQLSLNELAHIFLRGRNAESYQSLGSCDFNDHQAWSKLAILAQKTIYLARYRKLRMDDDPNDIGSPFEHVFYPDGTNKPVTPDMLPINIP